MFLTREELRELTGYAYRSRQIDWLRNHNWKFEVTAQKIPKVARIYFEARMGGIVNRQTTDQSETVSRPNFNAIIVAR